MTHDVPAGSESLAQNCEYSPCWSPIALTSAMVPNSARKADGIAALQTHSALIAPGAGVIVSSPFTMVATHAFSTRYPQLHGWPVGCSKSSKFDVIGSHGGASRSTIR